jgi:pimeloyl-ACP methyl ester carboxylesterase
VALVETRVIPTSDDHPVVVDTYPAASGSRVVVMCHGFKGHRRWGFIPGLAAGLAEAGVSAAAMDFSLNGHLAPGVTDVTDAFLSPEAFRRNTIARERDDLARTLDWVRRGGDGCVAPGAAVGLWAHSRGCVAAILAALDDPSISAIATWSAVAHPDFYTGRQKARWREQGAYEFTDGVTGSDLAVGVDYLDDLERHRDDYALAERAGGLRAAHLIIHGEQDMVIPFGDAVRLYDALEMAADKKLLRLATGHTFGYEAGATSEALDRAVHATVEWFDEYLPSGRE